MRKMKTRSWGVLRPAKRLVAVPGDWVLGEAGVRPSDETIRGMQELVLESEWTRVLGVLVRVRLVLDLMMTQLFAVLQRVDDRGIDQGVFELL